MSDPADELYEQFLVLRCQTGEERAFEELVERYSRRLRYFLRKMLGDLHLAEDALQAVWCDVFRNISRLRESTAFRAWVYRIARDRAYRELRRRNRAFVSLNGREIDEPAQDEEFSFEDAEGLHAALDRLNPERREVLVLRFLEYMSYEETAGVLGVPVGTVRSRLHYAKRELKQILERTANDE